MRRFFPWFSAFFPSLAGCVVYDDVTVQVDVPATFQRDFSDIWPDRALKVGVVFDGEASSFGIICDVGVQDERMRGNYLSEGCFDEHTVELWAIPVRPWDTMPCGPLFQRGENADDLSEATLVGEGTIAPTEKGRCGEAALSLFPFPDEYLPD